MINKIIFLIFICLGFQLNAQKKVKVDGVATVIGKNIVLNSEIAAFKKELTQQSEGKIKISDCEMLEEIMIQKLLSHHAVIDSIVVEDSEIEQKVDQTIGSFAQQLGSVEKVIEFYGFNDEDDLRKENRSLLRRLQVAEDRNEELALAGPSA
ncbi:MAG: peptidylprolyl isomerase, partial [Flavobacteriaceae bacterium]|nr:peptidylprolyl isomerase [Flavobacteriaceae bacterium]